MVKLIGFGIFMLSVAVCQPLLLVTGQVRSPLSRIDWIQVKSHEFMAFVENEDEVNRFFLRQPDPGISLDGSYDALIPTELREFGLTQSCVFYMLDIEKTHHLARRRIVLQLLRDKTLKRLNPRSPYSEESQEGQREQAREKNDEYGPLFLHDRIILASSVNVTNTAGIWQARAKRPLRTFLRNPNALMSSLV